MSGPGPGALAGILAGLAAMGLTMLVFGKRSREEVRAQGVADAPVYTFGGGGDGAVPRYSPAALKYAAAGQLFQRWTPTQVREFLATAQHADAEVVNQFQIDYAEVLKGFKGKDRTAAEQQVAAEVQRLKQHLS